MSLSGVVCLRWLCKRGQIDWTWKMLSFRHIHNTSAHQRTHTHSLAQAKRNVLGHEFMIIDHDMDFKLIFVHIFLCVDILCEYASDVPLFCFCVALPCLALLCSTSLHAILFAQHLQIFQSVHLKENFSTKPIQVSFCLVLFCCWCCCRRNYCHCCLLLKLLLLRLLLMVVLVFSLENLRPKSFLRSCMLFCVWYFHANCFNHSHIGMNNLVN